MAKRSEKDAELRSKPRVTQVLPVDLRVVEHPATRSGKPLLDLGADFAGRTINISEEGLLLNSDFELDRDTKLEITVMTGDDQTRPIQAMTKVAWSRRNAFDMFGRWAMGLRILDIEEKDLQTLKTFFHADED